MHDVFLQAALLEPPRILGVKLRPFSPGHALILESVGSPFIYIGEEIRFADIGPALFFCSRTFAQGRRMLARPADQSARIMSRFGARFRRMEWTARGRRRIDTAVEQILDYVTAYTVLPEHKTKGKPPSAPHLYQAVCALVDASNGAMTFDQAWDHPLALGVCYCSTVAELSGADSLLTGTPAGAAVDHIRSGGEWRTPRDPATMTDADREMQCQLDARMAARNTN